VNPSREVLSFRCRCLRKPSKPLCHIRSLHRRNCPRTEHWQDHRLKI
jgi:hypothetical protein